jgi:predicted NBD/HSP70 family sugar kinase
LAVPANERTSQGEQSAPSQEEVALHDELERNFSLPVFVQNDVTAAASAEMMFGSTKSSSDHLYWFLGAMLHSRLVLNNHVYTGNYNVSPASLDLGLLALQRRAERELEQSLDLHLESNWSRLGDTLTRWRSECVVALKGSIRALAQFVDIRTVVISAAVPQGVSDAMCVDLQRALPGLQVIGGLVRQAPKAVGAGSLPFISRFTVQP